MDILAALNDADPTRGERRCNLMQWLESIPADAAGRDELIRLVETKNHRNAPEGAPETRPAENMAKVLKALGYPTSVTPIHDHRNRDCACFR